MNGLVNSILLERGLQAFCWMLIHSLWQGLLLAIVTGIVMLLTNKAKAETRYVLTTGLFFTFLVVCCGTWIHEWNNGFATADSLTAKTGFGNIALLQHYGIDEWPAALAQYCSSHATYIVLGWFAIFSFRCWQMSRAFGYVRRVRTSGHQAPGAYWQNRISSLTQQLHIRRTVTMLESGITKVPVVIGHLKPVIYMPLGLLANLPPDQVEAVLLHELAHIRRNDYLVNLLQNIAETMFFFNPGLLWVSSLLKQEREHCCDDVALAHTGNKKQFIQALISFKEHVINGNNHVIAFPGKKNYLLRRVARIVYNRNNTLSGGEKIFLLSSLLVCFTLLGTMAGKHHTPAVLAVKEPAKEITIATAQPRQQPAAAPINTKERTVAMAKKGTTTSRRISTRADISVREREMVMNAQSIQEKAHEPTAEIIQQQRDEEMKAAIKGESETDRDRRRAEKDRQQAIRDREQAEKDRVQADRDREQADRDRQMADQHRMQAERDRQQADRDRVQAEKDREQAERDRAQATRDRLQAEEDRRQADKVHKSFDQKRVQQLRNTAAPLYANP